MAKTFCFIDFYNSLCLFYMSLNRENVPRHRVDDEPRQHFNKVQ